MKEKFKNLPEVLQWQIISRFAGGAGFFLLFIVIMLFYRNVYLWLPSLFFMDLLIVNGIFLLYNSINGNYVSVAGVCENIEFTGIRKRVKRITLKLEENSLKISVRHKIKKLKIGDTVIVYLSVKAPVYPQDDGYVVFNYYAMEVRNGV